MKYLLTLMLALVSFQSLSAFQPYDYRKDLEDRMEKINRDFDRAQNRMYQEDMVRLQRDANRINSSLQNQRGYRYGR